MWSSEERLNYALAFIKCEGKELDLDLWQEEFLKDKAKYSIVCKSRQSGFSFMAGLKSLVKAMDPDRKGYVCQFVSYRKDDAIEKIRYAKAFYHSIPPKCRKPLVGETLTSMEFRDTSSGSTSRLVSLSHTPPRGLHGDIFLDEMAIYPPRQMHDIYAAAVPIISRGGCLSIGSSPLGNGGDFYDIFTNSKKFSEYRRYTVSWWNCAALVCEPDDDEKTRLEKIAAAVRGAPSLPTAERVAKFGSNALKLAYSALDEDSFRQEYEATFVDAAQSFLPLDLIFSCVDESLAPPSDEDGIICDWLEKNGGKENSPPLYLGFDVARTRDASVIHVLEAGEKKRTVGEIVMRGEDFDRQERRFSRLMDELPIVCADIDGTGIGAQLAENMTRKYGAARVEAVIFSLAEKEAMAIACRTGLERGEFSLPNNQNFIRQLNSIKREASVGGHFRYDAQRNEQGHADGFWAWALAARAASGAGKKKSAYYELLKAKMRENGGKLPPTKPNEKSARRVKTAAEVKRQFERQFSNFYE